MTQERSRTIFISAAEASADKHAAKLIRQLHKELPQLNCDGLGGAAMAEAGCNLLENLVDRSAMLTHALRHIWFYFKLLGRIKRYFRETQPDLVVVMDSPAWNFHVAKAAGELGIPVLYYIVPQLWAWGGWRIGKLGRCVDRLACILPFEQQWFIDHGLNADYVGHPLFDDPNPVAPWPSPVQQVLGSVESNEHFPTIAILPGSRNHEIDHLWVPMQKIACVIKKQYPQARFISAVIDESYAEKLRGRTLDELEIDVRRTSVEAVTRHADLAIIASGTATLEAAAQYCPMIVMYSVNPLHWYLARRLLLKTKHISLVNILADKELVPEFVPIFGRLNAVAETALALLGDTCRLEQMRKSLQELIDPIVKPGASENVVRIIKEMLPKY